MTGTPQPRTDTTGDSALRSDDRRERPRIRALSLWFGVSGGVLGWALHLGVAWSVMEVSCLTPIDDAVLQQGGDSMSARLAAWCATALAWLIALAALITCVVLQRRLRRLGTDLLSGERTHLLLLVGLFLNSFAIAAISLGAISLGVLGSCS